MGGGAHDIGNLWGIIPLEYAPKKSNYYTHIHQGLYNHPPIVSNPTNGHEVALCGAVLLGHGVWWYYRSSTSQELGNNRRARRSNLVVAGNKM
jgi:hypothetical protein